MEISKERLIIIILGCILIGTLFGMILISLKKSKRWKNNDKTYKKKITIGWVPLSDGEPKSFWDFLWDAMWSLFWIVLWGVILTKIILWLIN